MDNVIRLEDKDTDRAIFYKVENDVVVGIDFNQDINDLSEFEFESDEEILGYFNKIYNRVEEDEKDSYTINKSLKKAVEIYCELNIY